jgi:hypothetical protein
MNIFKILVSTYIALSIFAGNGIGGISGGNGDKIHFQKHSTWVSAKYSRTLCFNGVDFKAKLRRCTKWVEGGDDRRCKKYKDIIAKQPQESTRRICKKFGGRDEDTCLEWGTARYFQNHKRIINKEVISIRSCN